MNFGGGSIIHCSAGVGRTGVVYITLNLLFEFGINPNTTRFPLTSPYPGITKAKIKETIMTSREYRMNLVQTLEQLAFIMECFCVDEIVDYRKDGEDKAITDLPIPKGYTTAFSEANPSKNRYGNILTYDAKPNKVRRVQTLITTTHENGYINASFAPCIPPPGERIPPNWNCPDFILSQCPIGSNTISASKRKDNTITDFQNMIRLNNIRRIIMVTGLVEGATAKCDDYLALDTQLKPDSITIVNEFTLYESKETAYGQIQEYTYTPLDSRERAGSSSSV